MAKTLATIFGVIFLLAGILGLFPNPIVGASGESIFAVNLAHNLVHLVTGLIFLLIASRSVSKAPLALKVLGVIYIIIAVLGFYVGEGQLLGFIAYNGADSWLHLVLGLVMLIAGFSAKNSSSSTSM